MSDVEVFTAPQQVVLVEADVAQQVVLVEVEVSQGPPGAMGPAGPNLPPPGVPDLGKVGVVRDKGAGPVWAADFLTGPDVHGGDLAVANANLSGALNIGGAPHNMQMFEAAGGAYTRINMDTANPSMWTWDTAQHVLSWQGNNAPAPQFALNDAGLTLSGSLVVQGNTASVGPNARVHMARDPAGTYGQVALDWQNLCAWRVTWATADLNWLVNGTPVFNITGAGNAHVYGTLRVDGAVSLGAITVTGNIGATGSIHADGDLTTNGLVTAAGSVTASAFVINGAATAPASPGVSLFHGAGYSRLTMDAANPSYWTWDAVNHNLTWSANNVAAPVFVIDATGNITHGGNLTCGPSARLGLAQVPAAYGEVILDNLPNGAGLYAWRCDWNVGGRLSWLANGAPVFTLDATGLGHFANALTVTNSITTAGGSFMSTGANGLQLFAQAGYSRLNLDVTNASFMTYDTAGRVLAWADRNNTVLQVDRNGQLSATNDIVAAGALKFGNGTHAWLETDNATYSRVMLDAVHGDYIQMNWTNRKLLLVIGSVLCASLDGAGNLVTKGAVTQNGTPGVLDADAAGLLSPADLIAMAEASAAKAAEVAAFAKAAPFVMEPA